MMKGKLDYLLMLALIISIIAILANTYKLSNQNRLIQNLKNYSIKQANVINGIAYNDSLQIIYSNTQIDGNIEVVSESGKKYTIKELVDENTLFFKYSQLSCGSCVEQEFKMLAEYISPKHQRKIIVMTDYGDVGLLYRFKRINKISHEMFNVQNQQIISSFENNYLPYYFVVDSSLFIRTIFVPSSSQPNLSKRFLQIVDNSVLIKSLE